ncbi:carboxymuconolactone decarboxylase family protein [Solimicrobium silvestre]|uniref:Putative gamma-carboxymuconolactone decarboxylase subunit.like protein n=1 Tax=Solimicrobium silvestre TaxID=2099400 RepID=A0A2S9GZG8_9BURK|nr:carboxymuconolactone decarboxylase family protein [Solimicrobium silvestre]PRC93124.1 putative gamma-carboxymuconolactone decarboxylase subunit .like protein [Solimicrobium silvestre]
MTAPLRSISETTLRGQRLMDTLEPGLSVRVGDRLSELDPGLERLVTDYAFGDVLSRPGLDIKTREMLTVAALTAMGNAPGQLELHMRGALNVGVTRAKLLEIVIQMALYAGLPACMNGVTAYRAVLAAADQNK